MSAFVAYVFKVNALTTSVKAVGFDTFDDFTRHAATYWSTPDYITVLTDEYNDEFIEVPTTPKETK